MLVYVLVIFIGAQSHFVDRLATKEACLEFAQRVDAAASEHVSYSCLPKQEPK